MKCTNPRNIFNLFAISDCKGCPKYCRDEELVIGDVTVRIYYINNGCKDLKEINKSKYNKDNHLEIATSKKLRLFLKDIMINELYNRDYIYLWLHDFDLNNEYDMNIIYSLLEFGLDIQLIIY